MLDTGIRTKNDEVVYFQTKIFKENELIQHKQDFFKFMQIILNKWEEKEGIPVRNARTISEQHVIKIVELSDNDEEFYVECAKEEKYKELAVFLTKFLSFGNKYSKSEGTRFYFLGLCFMVTSIFKDKVTKDNEKLSLVYYNQITRYFISSYLKEKGLQHKNVQVLDPRGMDTGIRTKNDEIVYFQPKIFKEKDLMRHKEDFLRFVQTILNTWEEKEGIPIKNAKNISKQHAIKVLKLSGNNEEIYKECAKEEKYEELAFFLTNYLLPGNKYSKSEGARYYFFGLSLTIASIFKNNVSNENEKLGPRYYNQIMHYFVSSYLKNIGLEPKNVQVLELRGMDTGIRTKNDEIVYFQPKVFKQKELIQHKEDFFKFMQTILNNWEEKEGIPVKNARTISEQHVIKIVKLCDNDREFYIACAKEEKYEELATFLTKFLLPGHKVVQSEGSRFYFLGICFKINSLFKGKMNDGEQLVPKYFNQITRYFISSYLKEKGLEPKNVQKIESNGKILHQKIQSKENIPPSLQTNIKVLVRSKNPLERTVEWHVDELISTMESDLILWGKQGFPIKITSSIEQLDELLERLTEKDFKSLTNLKPINYDMKSEQGKLLFELGELLAGKIVEKSQEYVNGNYKEPSNKICFLIRIISSCATKIIGKDISSCQISSYLEKIKPLVKWGATLNYYPEHVKVLEEKGFLETKTIYVTEKIEAFLDVCAKKIDEKFKEVNRKVFRIIGNKILTKHEELLEFVKGDQVEEDFYKTNMKYRSIAIFFINEFRGRIVQEGDLYCYLDKNGQKSSAEKAVDKFVTGFMVSMMAEDDLEKVHQRKDQPFIPRVVRSTLFELCGNINSKESGTKVNKSWNLLKEYDKVIN